MLLASQVVVLHLVAVPRHLARSASRSSRAVRWSDDLLLTDLVLAESVEVLEHAYGANRRAVADAMRSLVALRTVSVVSVDLCLAALEHYETDPLSRRFAEAHLAAWAVLEG